MESKTSGSGSGGGRKSGGSGGGGAEEGDGGDQDPESSSNQRRELESFRLEWRRELSGSTRNSVDRSPAALPSRSPLPTSNNLEDKAKVLFQMGIENEENGNFYEAVQFYKKAFQLVPDIELKLSQQNSHYISDCVSDDEKTDEDGVETEIEEEEAVIKEEDSEEEFNPHKTDLKSHLQAWMYRKNNNLFCTPHQPTHGARHLSDLPVEVMIYILRWVVGTELDMRSLEQVASVSRGLYVCSRDNEIWRLACSRVWRVRCRSLGSYGSWRDMFIFRSRVQTSGCYISKTTYIRPGENSFQDKCYRPWHLVQYFRYLRFFADGCVLMLTSSEEPVGCVGLLKGKPGGGPVATKSGAPVCQGYYRLLEPNIVSIIVSPPQQSSNKHQRYHQYKPPKQTFHIELEIVTYKNKLHGQLVWRRYTLLSSLDGVDTLTNFEIIASRFPPFWFSRVKSYHTESTSPLR